MKFTNTNNLPQEIVNAIIKDRYTDENEEPSDYSATSLISPVQQTILKKRYPDNHIIRDVTDYYWAFIGSIAHTVLEEAWRESMGSIVERRIYAEVDNTTISGKIDCYHNGEIRDYKSTKAYKIIKGDYSDWEKQLNIYAYLCSKNGLSVERLRIYAFLLDWKKHEIHKNKYPKCPIVEIPLRLWSQEEQEQYIQNRIMKLKCAETLSDDKLAEIYPCSENEMWQDVKDYCIKKAGAQRATKVFETEEEAAKYLKELSADYFIEKRLTKKTRCLEYCQVSHICKQNNKEEAIF